jgi:hypothetical protein
VSETASSRRVAPAADPSRHVVEHELELTLLKITDVFTEFDSKQEYMEWLKSQALAALDAELVVGLGECGSI